jgi:cytidylate kinase
MEVVIVNGAPASGKTTLINRITETHNYTVISKDAIKEQFYETADHRIRWYEWWSYESKSWQKFQQEIDLALAQTEEVLIEANITPPMREKIKRQLGSAGVRELYCYTSTLESIRRFRNRMHDESRHKYHFDALTFGMVALEQTIEGLGIHRYKPLLDESCVLRVDTTDSTKIDYERIADFLESNPAV